MTRLVVKVLEFVGRFEVWSYIQDGLKCGAISKMPDSVNLCPLWTVRSRTAIEGVDGEI